MLGGPLGCKQMSFSACVSQSPTVMYRARLAAELAVPEQLSCHDTNVEILQGPPLVTACIAIDMHLIQRIPYFVPQSILLISLEQRQRLMLRRRLFSVYGAGRCSLQLAMS